MGLGWFLVFMCRYVGGLLWGVCGVVGGIWGVLSAVLW